MSLLSSTDIWKPTRIALVAIVLSLVSSAGIGIIIVLVGDFDETEVKILATTGTLTGFSILSLPSLFHLERTRYPYVSKVAIFASIAFFGMILLLIWGGDIGGGEMFWKSLGSAGVVSIAINHSLLLLIPISTKKLISLSQRITVSIIAIVGILILVAIWVGDLPGPLIRILGALVILDALGTIAVPMLVRISK